jgi:hypothetical protein
LQPFFEKPQITKPKGLHADAFLAINALDNISRKFDIETYATIDRLIEKNRARPLILNSGVENQKPGPIHSGKSDEKLLYE